MELSVKERAKLLEQQSNCVSFPCSRPSPRRPSLVPKSRAISTPHFDGREAKQDLFGSGSHSSATALKNAKSLLPVPPQHGRSLSTDGTLQNSKAKPPPPVPGKPNNIQQKLNELQLAKTPRWSPPGTTRTESTNAVLIVTVSDDERHDVDHAPPEHLRRDEETPPPTEDEPRNALIQVTQQVSTFSKDFVNNTEGIINPWRPRHVGVSLIWSQCKKVV